MPRDRTYQKQRQRANRKLFRGEKPKIPRRSSFPTKQEIELWHTPQEILRRMDRESGRDKEVSKVVLLYVGNNLRLAREQKKFNQRQLAEASHTPQSIISDIELGKRKPWPKLARRLSRVLNVSTKDLFPEGISNGR